MPTNFSILCWQGQEFKQNWVLLISVLPYCPFTSVRETPPSLQESNINKLQLAQELRLTHPFIQRCSPWLPRYLNSFVFVVLRALLWIWQSDLCLLWTTPSQFDHSAFPPASIPNVTGPQHKLDVCLLEWDWVMLWTQPKERQCRKIRQIHDLKRVYVWEGFSRF